MSDGVRLSAASPAASGSRFSPDDIEVARFLRGQRRHPRVAVRLQFHHALRGQPPERLTEWSGVHPISWASSRSCGERLRIPDAMAEPGTVVGIVVPDSEDAQYLVDVQGFRPSAPAGWLSAAGEDLAGMDPTAGQLSGGQRQRLVLGIMSCWQAWQATRNWWNHEHAGQPSPDRHCGADAGRDVAAAIQAAGLLTATIAVLPLSASCGLPAPAILGYMVNIVVGGHPDRHSCRGSEARQPRRRG